MLHFVFESCVVLYEFGSGTDHGDEPWVSEQVFEFG